MGDKPTDFKFGFHVSIAGGLHKIFQRADDLDCDTLQIFTRNPRGWKVKEITDDDLKRYHETKKMFSFDPIVSHMPYLPNLSSPDREQYEKSKRHLEIELDRCELLKIPYIVTHCGSHKGKGRDVGIKQISKAIEEVLTKTETVIPMLLLENTAGSKNSVGSSISDLEDIINQIPSNVTKRVGFCFDTCHAFAAGYDLRTSENIDVLFEEFNSHIGKEKLKLIHINDSKSVLGGHLDRHHHIGKGFIGEEGFMSLFKHPFLSKIPMIAETPIEKDKSYGDKENMAMLRGLVSRIKKEIAR